MSCQVMEKARVVGMGLCKALWDCDLKQQQQQQQQTQKKQMNREENRVEMQRGKGPPRETTWMP